MVLATAGKELVKSSETSRESESHYKNMLKILQQQTWMLSGQTLNSDEEICLIEMQKTDIYKASNFLLCLPKQIIAKQIIIKNYKY